MGIRKYKPTSAGRRNASVSDFATLTPGSIREKSLLRPLPKKGGRNNHHGVISEASLAAPLVADKMGSDPVL